MFTINYQKNGNLINIFPLILPGVYMYFLKNLINANSDFKVYICFNFIE